MKIYHAKMATWTLALFFFTIFKHITCNLSPSFTLDMNNLALSENTPVGEVVYKLEGTDPEGSPVFYGLIGTDRFHVDRSSGIVTLVQPLDREVNDTLNFLVTLEDQVEGAGLHENNIVQVPISVIVYDENDNAPQFENTPYETLTPEDTPIGTTIFNEISVKDLDTLGETLEVQCVHSTNGNYEHVDDNNNACNKFGIVQLSAAQGHYSGAIVLRQPLNYNEKPFYQMILRASDGDLNSTTSVEIKVGDVQNTPPIFTGSLTGVVEEDAPVNTLIMTIHAKDGDRGMPRKIIYELVTNPMDYFLLDAVSGELRTAKPLDKEALDDTTGVLTLTVKAREVIDGKRGDDELTVTTAEVTITIKDVNDEPPTFNRNEYYVEIQENVPNGTPLPHLDMTVRDPDVGSNSAFSLKLDDISGAFTVEPSTATGSTSVSIRVVNGSLDYENPNQRKFIVLVIAEELHTNPKLSSTATVVVSVTDANDNAPTFELETYSAKISETATPGTLVTVIAAKDRDSGRFGENGIIYQLLGNGAEKFYVDNRTGVITVAQCNTPGAAPCLDFETQNTFFLSYKATDDDGKGQTSIVPLRITLLDSNDNAPIFTNERYRVQIDEGATRFEPELQIQARDVDVTSQINYSIIAGNVNNLFAIDSTSGKIHVVDANGLDVTSVGGNNIVLTVEASDGKFTSTCEVNITVHDVNNNAPVFENKNYLVAIQENAEIGSEIINVTAHDADSGLNAAIQYQIQKGAFDDFAIEDKSGVVLVKSKLDYDRRNTYEIEIIAVDGGVPSLTGTTTLTASILNINDKFPYFVPSTQRAEISEDAKPGTIVHTLTAMDPDVTAIESLHYKFAGPISAVDKNGQLVSNDTQKYQDFFAIDENTGTVTVAQKLNRDLAAVVRITVVVTDTTAPVLQEAQGTLIITIVDVNDFPPEFEAPWTKDNPNYHLDLLEEQPIGSIIRSFPATDRDSNIARYEIRPASEYFDIDNVTGVVKITKRIDYESTKSLNFTVIVYDSGIPQMSATAHVHINVININDMSPEFKQIEYFATVDENSPIGTYVTNVTAEDRDDGEFGVVKYSLIGEHSADFKINENTGVITVKNQGLLDRETIGDVTIQVSATDGGPENLRKTVAVPVHIKIQDVNDNPPMFVQRNYKSTIVENLVLHPPSPILQVRADDSDDGINAEVRYKIIDGNVEDVFSIDAKTGIIYPNKTLTRRPRHYHLTVEARDQEGKGEYFDKAYVDVEILDVNQHKPEFVMPALANATVEIPENAARVDYLVMTVKAMDRDFGENGRVSYHLKVDNQNVQETNEFIIDADTGELKTKMFLDREIHAKYDLVLVARDHGSPTSYESLRFLTILLADINDNRPEFPDSAMTNPYQFFVAENAEKDLRIGQVHAVDRDLGTHAKVYYYIISGNDDHSFYLSKTDGNLYTNKSFDREAKSVYGLLIIANNDPDYYLKEEIRNIMTEEQIDHDSSIAKVKVTILDENDNVPHFHRDDYYVGINVMADINYVITTVKAEDPDFGENGTIIYYIKTSNLYKYGSEESSGSIIPSPFNITEDGKLITANYMAEYNQDRFVVSVVAREKAYPEREAVTKVHVWIYEPEQLIKIMLSRPASEVYHEKDEIIAELSNATQSLVVVDEIRFHTDSANRIHSDWCDMLIHVVDPKTQTIAKIPEVLKLIDSKYDFLKDYYAGYAIENVIPVVDFIKKEPFDPALAALIALLIVLFVGVVTFLVVCCFLRNWVITIPTNIKKKDALIKKQIIEDLNTTENPLWIEQKLKLYEEQELTMQVFSEPDSHLTDINGTRSSNDSNCLLTLSPQMHENAYATIQQTQRRNSKTQNSSNDDYATLTSNLNHSLLQTLPSSYEAALGFQGCTFQVPHPLDESDSSSLNDNSDNHNLSSNNASPFLSNDRSKSLANQPDYVAELI